MGALTAPGATREAATRDPATAGRPGQTLSTAPLVPMLAAQTRAQVRQFWRLPAVSVTGLVMPVMLFLFFVAPHAREPWQGDISLGAYMLASIGAYAVGSVMVFNFGVAVALDRGQKIDVLMRAAPLPGWLFLTARMIGALLFGVAAIALLFAVALVVGGVALAPLTWLGLGARLLLGSTPFIGLGFAIAYLGGPSAAPAIANLVFIAMAFASGMLVRIDQMPDLLRAIAPMLPTYHYAQLAWDVIGASDESALTSAAWLVAFGVGLFSLAAFAHVHETRRKFA
jgi:ABC-2 type transport system permease protein